MESLKGKNILVTGATGGIGNRVVKLLVTGGANVFITGRNIDKLNSIAIECGIPDTQIKQADISNAQQVNELKEAFFQSFTTIDILVNAAGIGIIKSVENLSDQEFMKTLQCNLIAPFLLVQSFLPSMKEQKKGLIINIPGVLGKVPMAGAAA
jgi:short-subunit dehydrogenase